MTLLQLSYFVEVCKLGNITKAAATLHISQPAVSKNIMELEREFGASFILRRKSGITLTREGQELFSRAEKLLKHAEKLEADMRRLCGQQKKLRVGVSILFEQLYPEFLDAYRSAHRDVSLKSYSFGSMELQQFVMNDSLDVAVSGITDDFALPHELLLSSESVLWTNRQNPLAKKPLIDMTSDLRDETLGLFRESSIDMHEGVDSDTRPLPPDSGARIAFCTNQLNEIILKLRSNSISTFLPENVFRDRPELISIHTKQAPAFSIAAYWHDEHVPSHVLEFIEFAKRFVNGK